MVKLPIKRKWYEMILSGEKKEEYREIKPYWIYEFKQNIQKDNEMLVMFVNGYDETISNNFLARVRLTRGVGRPEWGAPSNEVFILKILEIIE